MSAQDWFVPDAAGKCMFARAAPLSTPKCFAATDHGADTNAGTRNAVIHILLAAAKDRLAQKPAAAGELCWLQRRHGSMGSIHRDRCRRGRTQ